ncbi:MAG: hypothetical protein LH628_16750 [Microcoleus sp. CAN_BIN18]|nr:hypothetical protein [Microcoleus sp. CAN_BIN18]
MMLTAKDRPLKLFGRGKKMETTVQKEAPHQLVEEVKINNINSSEFELWAKAVKRQMIAALSKKGAV